jgi:DNA polymerase-3 subunit epsilon
MDFVCVDVETANEYAGSICQIGAATFVDGTHRPELDIEMYIDPEDYFRPEFSELHGISELQVSGAPNFEEVYPMLERLLLSRPVLAHSAFDRVSLRQAAARYHRPELSLRWLDTLRVARRAWPERMHKEGHRLRDLAKLCGITFKHHSALQDAWCAGQLFLHACGKTGFDLERWCVRVMNPFSNGAQSHRVKMVHLPMNGLSSQDP